MTRLALLKKSAIPFAIVSCFLVLQSAARADGSNFTAASTVPARERDCTAYRTQATRARDKLVVALAKAHSLPDWRWESGNE